MNYSKLKNNITDVIKEEQLKLGYRSETIRLYYPLASLNRFLSGNFTIAQMHEALKGFSDSVREELGDIEVSNKGERFCLKIPPKGVDYVHEHMDSTEFICRLIKTVERHGCTIEEVLQQFYAYSDKVHVEKVSHGEFDYLVYFEDGKPDDYRYCLTDEGTIGSHGHHIIYHRYTIEDYEDFRF